MKFIDTKTTGIALILAIVLSACASEEPPKKEQTKPMVTASVIKPGLIREFTVTGEVTAEQKAILTANTRSNVEEISVKPGDTVTNGQRLLLLSSDSVNARVVSANTSYATAVRNVDQSKITGNANIETAKVNLETSQANLEALLKQNEAAKQRAIEELQQVQVRQDVSVKTANVNLDNAIRTSLTSVNQAFTVANTILEISDELRDITYRRETHVGVRNPTLKYEAVILLKGLSEAVRNSPETYESALYLLSTAENALRLTLDVLSFSVTSSDYTQELLDQDITATNNQLASVRNARADLEAKKRAVDEAEQSNNSRSQTLISAEASYEATIAQLEAAEVQARQDIKQKQIALESAIASAEASEISAVSTLNSIGSQLRDAQVSRRELSVNAPFNGQIVDVPVRKGQEVAAGEDLVIVENRDSLKIIAYLSEDEISYVTVGDPVRINDTISSSVSALSNAADPISKKYKVEILLENNALKSGSFVDITFTGRISDSSRQIFAPISAVHISANETYVWTLEAQSSGSLAIKTPVTIGELQGEYIELQSGIASGQLLVVQGGRLLKEDEIEVTSNLMAK